MTVTKTERQARIDRDDGDPSGTVHRIHPADSTRNYSATAYHDDADCRQLHGNTKRDIRVQACERASAQADGCWPCSDCVLGEVSPGASGGEGGSTSRLEKLIQDGEVPEEHLGSPFETGEA